MQIHEISGFRTVNNFQNGNPPTVDAHAAPITEQFEGSNCLSSHTDAVSRSFCCASSCNLCLPGLFDFE